ncbi:alpha/beta fold hydrolase [Sphingomonas populi]|uniref:Alpha/beta fold hydrolase n=1 Tax=Sphingomonas populi TaxID=2484750 RepID=A0A4Q6Y153_9SPHN|nr:alpha/beta fold hydrolase [Sphingomonas populi]
METRNAAIVSRRTLLAAGLGAALIPARGFAVGAEPNKIVLQAPGGRTVEVWHWLPTGKRRGTMTFSHGAASAPWKYAKLMGPLAAAGYEIFAPLHVDSTDHPRTKDFPGFASWKARIEDMRVVSAAISAPRFIAAGHSYGGLMALTQGGAQAMMPEGLKGAQRDPRVTAVVAFSPPGIMPGLISAEGYAKLAVPALIQTGDQDVPIGGTDPAGWRAHLAAYEAAAPGGDRYALVLAGVDHYFGGEICRALPGPPQSAQLEQASALADLFLQAYFAKDARARRALDLRLADTGPVRLARK